MPDALADHSMLNAPRSLARPPLWAAYLAAGALAVVPHALLETGSLTQSFLYDAIGASAVAAAFIGMWLDRRPTVRLPAPGPARPAIEAG
jgi:hypothetical protein